MALSDNYNENPATATIPLVDENSPGLGRHSGLIEQQRRDGGLPDDPADLPVIDDTPFRVVR